MSDIDELKARAEKLGLIVSYRSDGDAYIKHSRYDFHLRWHTAKAAIIMAESSARIAAERVKASARICECVRLLWTGSSVDAWKWRKTPEANCIKCHGTGVRFEEQS
jgi:hypothetical protein